MGTFDLGYLVSDGKKAKVIAFLGLGGFGYGINVTKSRSIQASEAAKNPGHELNMSRGGFVIDASVLLNVVPAPSYDEREKTRGGLSVGVRLGYSFSMASRNWYYSGGSVTDAPKFGLSMPYVKVLIGGFGERDRNGRK